MHLLSVAIRFENPYFSIMKLDGITPLPAFVHEGGFEAGCDEAGRGCLAGPVCAAAVILPPDKRVPALIRDSKQLSAKQRAEAADWVQTHALSWAVAYCSPAEIDEINILNASFAAMHRALDALPEPPDRVIVDGHRFTPYRETPRHCVVKGDGKFAHIGAASILAKTYRDRFMALWHEDYPEYQWMNNKGYPTAAHIEAVRALGITPLHRRSFRIKGKQLKMKL